MFGVRHLPGAENANTPPNVEFPDRKGTIHPSISETLLGSTFGRLKTGTQRARLH